MSRTPSQGNAFTPQGSFKRGSSFGDFMNGLGGLGGGPSQEVQELTKKLQEIKLPEEARKIVDQEI